MVHSLAFYDLHDDVKVLGWLGWSCDLFYIHLLIISIA
jgi:hypothetical protein